MKILASMKSIIMIILKKCLSTTQYRNLKKYSVNKINIQIIKLQKFQKKRVSSIKT